MKRFQIILLTIVILFQGLLAITVILTFTQPLISVETLNDYSHWASFWFLGIIPISMLAEMVPIKHVLLTSQTAVSIVKRFLICFSVFLLLAALIEGFKSVTIVEGITYTNTSLTRHPVSHLEFYYYGWKSLRRSIELIMLLLNIMIWCFAGFPKKLPSKRIESITDKSKSK